ncbi:MAG TPA: undecaprenyl-diphosphate phosphatase [Gemmatimonadales bacterium]|jgi:undecaprenyl-diphosphatase
MTWWQGVVLGLAQGLTEFLPVSSSAHLTLIPWAFGWQDPGLAFDVALHLGTLVALAIYFRREWVTLAGAGLSIVRHRRIETPSERMVLWIIVATIPGAVAGVLFNKWAESTFRSPQLIAAALATLGVLLWLVDRTASQARKIDTMGWPSAIAVGVAQMFALVPGVSRSGSTITAARWLGFDREAAAVFSFMLSLPIIAGAVLVEGRHVIRESPDLTPVLAGLVASAVSGWIAIGVLLRFVLRRSYGAFAVYRVVLAAGVLALAWGRP